jgi:hypothetical protein
MTKNKEDVMEKTKEVLENAVKEMLKQAEQNADRYISISENETDLITGLTVFIDT